jgi:hypothetical protein
MRRKRWQKILAIFGQRSWVIRCLGLTDRHFKQMSKDKFNPDGVRNSAEWQRIRGLTSGASKAFGWPPDEPPRRDHEFMPGGPNEKHFLARMKSTMSNLSG